MLLKINWASIARDVGFKDVSFQFEPIAAAYDYEQSIQKEELALIIDIGGGYVGFHADSIVARAQPAI